MTVKEYLSQFTPEQLLKACQIPRPKYPFDNSEEPTDEQILAPDGWRWIAPVWMQDFEQPGMVTLEEIREQGGFECVSYADPETGHDTEDDAFVKGAKIP